MKVPTYFYAYAAALFCAIATSFVAQASIVSIPFKPRTADDVSVSVVLPPCAYFQRFERADNRILVFAFESRGFQPCPANTIPPIALGKLPAGNYAVEVLMRYQIGTDRTTVESYSLVNRHEFQVEVGNASNTNDAPARIAPIGNSSVIVSPNALSNQTIGFRITDANGSPVARAPVAKTLTDTNGQAFQPNCNLQEVTYVCDGLQSDLRGELLGSATSFALENAGTQFGTLRGSTVAANNSVLSAYIAIGTIDDARKGVVVPVIEYKIFNASTGTNAYFLSASDTEVVTLDGIPAFFNRTYAAFFGLKANTPGAVPVCRFFKPSQNGTAAYHWFTADPLDCANKNADPNFVREGEPFWAYPARPDESCARGQRPIFRYLLQQERSSPVVAVRYSFLQSMKNAAASANPVVGYFVKDDGVAFCVPD
jgi:hypothetical protein